MFNRRKLFGFAAAAPVAAIGLGPEKAAANNAPQNEIMKLSSGDPAYRMLLTARKEEEKRKEVSMGIGSDGHLWVKVNDQWKRVSLE